VVQVAWKGVQVRLPPSPAAAADGEGVKLHHPEPQQDLFLLLLLLRLFRLVLGHSHLCLLPELLLLAERLLALL
jgi:hypothetical protein